MLIEDLGSSNGTLVNGSRIDAPHLLSPGDKVQVGDSTLELLADDAGAQKTRLAQRTVAAAASAPGAAPPGRRRGRSRASLVGPSFRRA